MGFPELFMIAIGLSMDAFAVSLLKGLGMKRMCLKRAGVIALLFGGFQAGMPLLGWLFARRFEVYVVAYDHWVAFGLLMLIGGKMIWESAHGSEEAEESGTRLDLRELLALSVATSIDALAVGITFAFLQVHILPSASLIGVVTLAVSFAGVILGNRLGPLLMQKAEVGGGIVLILIGVKILLEHLGML